MKRRYDYNKDTKKATFTSSKTYKGQLIVGKGTSQPHKDDLEFVSEYVGISIAEMKSLSDFYRKRANVKKAELEKLQRAMENLENSMLDDQDLSEGIKAMMKDYMAQKDEQNQMLKMVKARKAAGSDTLRWEDLGDVTPEEYKTEEFQAEMLQDAIKRVQEHMEMVEGQE